MIGDLRTNHIYSIFRASPAVPSFSTSGASLTVWEPLVDIDQRSRPIVQLSFKIQSVPQQNST